MGFVSKVFSGCCVKICTTPGFPGQTLENYVGEPVEIEAYRSLTGHTLYYVVKDGPGCANATRDLVKYMNFPGPDHWKAIEQIIGYLKGKKIHGHKYRKPLGLRSINLSDSDYAAGKNSRESVCEMICTLGGMLTHWNSRNRKTTRK